MINSIVNKILVFFGREKLSFSKTIKNKVKAAVSFINKFETTVTNIALKNQFDYVICGHIHQPCIKKIDSKNGNITYLNSGDWVENMTALEYNHNEWTLFQYDEKLFKNEEFEENEYKNTKTLFSDLLTEININTNN